MPRPSITTPEEIDAWLADREAGLTYRQIADKHGATYERVTYNIAPGRKKLRNKATMRYVHKNYRKVYDRQIEYQKKHKPWRKKK